MITDIDKNRITQRLSNEFDFFRRLDGRLRVQRQRLQQVKTSSEAEKVQKVSNKLDSYKTKILEIQYCISEMEFIRNNIIDDFFERGY